MIQNPLQSDGLHRTWDGRSSLVLVVGFSVVVGSLVTGSLIVGFFVIALPRVVFLLALGFLRPLLVLVRLTLGHDPFPLVNLPMCPDRGFRAR